MSFSHGYNRNSKSKSNDKKSKYSKVSSKKDGSKKGKKSDARGSRAPNGSFNVYGEMDDGFGGVNSMGSAKQQNYSGKQQGGVWNTLTQPFAGLFSKQSDIDKTKQKTVYVELFRQNTDIVLQNFDQFIDCWVSYQKRQNPKAKKEMQVKLCLMNESMKVFHLFAKNVVKEGKTYGKTMSDKELLHAKKKVDDYFSKVKKNDSTGHVTKRMDPFYQVIDDMLKDPTTAPELPFIDLNAKFTERGLSKSVGTLMVASHQRQDKVKHIEENPDLYSKKHTKDERELANKDVERPFEQRQVHFTELYPEVDKSQIKYLPSAKKSLSHSRRKAWDEMQLQTGQAIQVRRNGNKPGERWQDAKISNMCLDPSKIRVILKRSREEIEILWDPEFCKLPHSHKNHYLNDDCPPPNLGGADNDQMDDVDHDSKEEEENWEEDTFPDNGKMYGADKKIGQDLEKSNFNGVYAGERRKNQLSCDEVVEYRTNMMHNWSKGKVSRNVSEYPAQLVNIIDSRTQQEYAIPLSKDYVKRSSQGQTKPMTDVESSPKNSQFVAGELIEVRMLPTEPWQKAKILATTPKMITVWYSGKEWPVPNNPLFVRKLVSNTQGIAPNLGGKLGDDDVEMTSGDFNTQNYGGKAYVFGETARKSQNGTNGTNGRGGIRGLDEIKHETFAS